MSGPEVPRNPRLGNAHPATLAVLRWFEYGHLPPDLAAVSGPFRDLAYLIAETLPPDPETTAALRALLQAKDCAVRAAIAGRDTL